MNGGRFIMPGENVVVKAVFEKDAGNGRFFRRRKIFFRRLRWLRRFRKPGHLVSTGRDLGPGSDWLVVPESQRHLSGVLLAEAGLPEYGRMVSF